MVLTAFSLPLQHQCMLGSLQVVHHHVAAVKGRHHVGGVTTVEVHRCGDAVLCRHTQTHTWLEAHSQCSCVRCNCGVVLRGAPRVLVLTLVCVESADAGVFLLRVPQFHRSVSRAGQEAVLDAAVSQSPHSVCMLRP